MTVAWRGRAFASILRSALPPPHCRTREPHAARRDDEHREIGKLEPAAFDHVRRARVHGCDNQRDGNEDGRTEHLVMLACRGCGKV